MSEENQGPVAETVVVDPELVEEAAAVEAVEAEINAQVREQEETDGDGDTTDPAIVVPPIAPEEPDTVVETEQAADEEPDTTDERRWPRFLAIGLIVLMVLAVIVVSLIGSCEGTPTGNQTTTNISKVIPTPPPLAPPTKAPAQVPVAAPVPTRPETAPAKQATLPPPPVLDTTSPSGNVTGTVDTTLQGVNVNATNCRTRMTLLEQGSKVILRTTYDCPPAAVGIVTGNE